MFQFKAKPDKKKENKELEETMKLILCEIM